MQHLGQHFLHNTTAISRMITAVPFNEHLSVIEIGGGKGALSFPLAERALRERASLFIIEKDLELAELLSQELSERDLPASLIRGDVLRELPLLIKKISAQQNSSYVLIGNIPYYLTGNLFRIVSAFRPLPQKIIFTIQREVAERILAVPPRMNLLAAAIQIWAHGTILAYLPRTDFSPPPHVDSSLIALTPYAGPPLSYDLEHYYSFIHALFKQPRKTIFNNLRDSLQTSESDIQKALTTLGIHGSERPQNLSLKMLIDLGALLM